MKRREPYTGEKDPRCIYCLAQCFHFKHEHERSAGRKEREKREEEPFYPVKLATKPTKEEVEINVKIRSTHR